MTVSHRLGRIESEMQLKLAKLIQTDIDDPRLKFVTITRIKISRDLSVAKVYVVARDEEQAEEVLELLSQNAKTLRFQLAHAMNLRKMPELRFYYDENLVKADRISKLLHAKDS